MIFEQRVMGVTVEKFYFSGKLHTFLVLLMVFELFYTSLQVTDGYTLCLVWLRVSLAFFSIVEKESFITYL